MKLFKAASLITAIKTPYLKDGSIDLDCYDRLVQFQVDAGVDGIIVGGTTGEGQLLNWEEHLMLIAHSANKFGEKLLIIGNSGSNNTREAVKATEYGFASGMHAALQINPYYGKTSIRGMLEHFKAVLESGPAFIYNVPGRTGQDISPDIIQQLSNHKHFIGVKECAGNDRIAHYEQQGIACWSGNDDECFVGRHQYGSHGVISVTSNIIPTVMRALMDTEDAELNNSIQELITWLFCEPNPIPINTALMMTGAVPTVFRLPYYPLSKQQRTQGYQLLGKLNHSKYVGEQLEILGDDDFVVII